MEGVGVVVTASWVELALASGTLLLFRFLRLLFYYLLVLILRGRHAPSYDIRFPEYALLLTQKHQCKILIYPGAFNLTTGPAHWELLQRARAVDGQCYVLTASPARMPIPPPSSTAPDDDDADNDDDAVPTMKYPHYSAWGHSSVISPWGEVIATCDENPAIVMADLDMNKVTEMRMAIPTMVQKRHDLYRLVEGRNAPGDDNA